ncbi:helix-hairpin-helix domain-containing protein [Pseudalkalibacillus hwajinpoensis]|uniref:helix-hairpin-helix domain-containing protein n=1 Tax=Guptibacillus hwajinpoensis TaxID=208199 RepID=UPI00325ABDE5
MKFTKSFTAREKGLLMIAIAGIVLSIFLYIDPLKAGKEEAMFVQQELGGDKEESASNSKVIDEEPDADFVMVDIKGAVASPGVYELQTTGRVKGVIAKAGGFIGDADQSKLNLAGKVVDEMVIYVPVVGELTLPPQGLQVGESDLISINTVDSSQLQELPGIGHAKSEAIIQYREENGGFKVIEDLQKISGIGEKTFEKLKDVITVK